MPVEQQYRYPGVTPFSTAQKDLFFGREQDIQRLYELLSWNQQVLLYSKSGLGKSSLINAGLLPRLAQGEEKRHSLTVRFGAYQSERARSPLDAVLEALKQSGLAANYKLLDRVFPQENSLWYHFKARQLAGAEHILLIFDQFEELFSYPEDEIMRFKKQLADLLYKVVPASYRKALDLKRQKNETIKDKESRSLHKPQNVKVLFAIREDRYSWLNQLRDYLPDMMHHRYALLPLTEAQAREAIEAPARQQDKRFVSKPFSFSPEALDKIIQFLTKGGEQSVETTQLQILCHRLEQLDLETVQPEDIPDFSNIFQEYYQSCLDKVPGSKRLAVRRFIENQLIQKGQRLSLDGRIFPEAMDEQVLHVLVQEQHLLRAEMNSTGGISYELSHDTLVGPILEAKQQREAQEALEEAEREAKRQAEEEAQRNRELQAKLEAEEAAAARQRWQLRIVMGLFVMALIACAWALYERSNAYTLSQELSDKLEELVRQKQAREMADSLKEAEELRRIQAEGLKIQAEREKVLLAQEKMQVEVQRAQIEEESQARQDEVNKLAFSIIDEQVKDFRKKVLTKKLPGVKENTLIPMLKRMDRERAKIKVSPSFDQDKIAKLDETLKDLKNRCECPY